MSFCCSQVYAQQARIAALEAESAAAAAEHASRLSEQQKSFLSKLEQLRHVHGQQLALQQVLPSAAAVLSSSSAADECDASVSMLQVMEGQLARLSCKPEAAIAQP
eukprot:gene1415-1757_t